MAICECSHKDTSWKNERLKYAHCFLNVQINNLIFKTIALVEIRDITVAAVSLAQSQN